MENKTPLKELFFTPRMKHFRHLPDPPPLYFFLWRQFFRSSLGAVRCGAFAFVPVFFFHLWVMTLGAPENREKSKLSWTFDIVGSFFS